VGGWDVLLQGRLNQPNYVLNFYGLGNNTELVSKSRTFNRVRISQGMVRTGLQRTLNAKHTISLLAELESNRVENLDKRFVSATNPALDSSQFERHHWLGGTAAYTFSTINRPLFPTKGVIWNNTSRYLYTARQSDDFFNQEASFAFFLPLGGTVFAARIGGATLWGEPQFFQYNQLSGLENLRGYRRGRFTGKSMVYNNNEWRIPLTNFRTYLVAGKLGLSLFVDNGRVWMPDEDSNRWHWGYGGGVWMLPFGRVAFSAHYGISSEDKVFTVRSGFLF
jgi:outer membrane protein assembly factor BamA